MLCCRSLVGCITDNPEKGIPIPYIAQLLRVCALVFEAGGDEDRAVATFLHSAVGDQDGLPTLDTIRQMFGDRVAILSSPARIAQ
jgi:(p)ppGpp synthase/HD superfamily hydrolase